MCLFQKFGEVASVSVLRDKESGNAKGFGYVRYYRAYHAALALEECEKCNILMTFLCLINH